MFSSISICIKPAEKIEQAIGFKGLSIASNRQQFIEQGIGFKGLSLAYTTDQRGVAQKIVHFRWYKG
ncbi:hypothetical protein [Mucilaginibacter terrae]|uniref:Uncharacterized protein n=1 Tax=Mucilaginibacter terrae TaxID=1955052 RepID=A0ABU3GZA6_9SPHI|nr:hypothetical protein [Mucilaginibacter terrae]MDT3405094.1 hypothetical protein [Mucilaginibacter terrae]